MARTQLQSDEAIKFMVDNPTVVYGLLGSLAAGLATTAGALPIFFIKRITDNVQGAMLGFGAGVMLAATSFSLIIPGIEAATSVTGNPVTAGLIVATGILLGGVFLWFTHRNFPHEHFIKGSEGNNPSNLARVWLFILAIALHNFPEGLAVGVGFASGEVTQGLTLATGIGLQNIPEGMVVALSLVAERYSKLYALWIVLITGLVEPFGGLIGAAVVSLAKPLIPWGLAFAAGAMLFVISDEIIPESHRLGYEKQGTIGLMLGFILMMLLDVILG